MTSSAELRVITASGDGSEALVRADATAYETVSLAEIRKEVKRILGSAKFDASRGRLRSVDLRGAMSIT